MDVSVGVITHNDASLLELVNSALNQKANGCAIKEAFVISSGILPENKDGLEALSGKHPRLNVIIEPQRTGKAMSVNTFLKYASCEVCVLISGDVLIESNSIAELVKPLADGNVGMVGARLIPMNDQSAFLGFAVHLIWQLHHRLSLIKPKLGELVAFRKVVAEISPKTAVDEAWIESIIAGKGYMTAYAPASIARNMGPRNLSEYVSQRRRIHTGHIHLKRERGYVVSSMIYRDVFRALAGCLTIKPKEIVWTIAVLLLELYIRFSANIDVFVFGRNPYCWDILPSAKIS